MRYISLVWIGLAACGGRGGDADTGLPPFDPSVVVFADGCDPAPEARACIEAHPRQFDPPNALAIQASCTALGYTCCDSELWISEGAATCIAETDARFSVFAETHATLTCTDQVFGPMFGVYGQGASGNEIGVGVHAATGRITFFDDGSGVFS